MSHMSFLKRGMSLVNKLIHRRDVIAVRLTKDQWDGQYARGKWDYLVQGEPNLAVTVAVCGMLAAKRGSDKPLSVLDVGCGNGAIPLGLKATGVAYTYYGTDISPKAIEKAKELCADAQFECIDMEQGTTTDRKFDVVIFSEVLLYADWKKTFAEHRRNMRADTVVIISLYRTIRTWLIWRYFLPRLKLLYEYRIRDVRKKNAWDICVGTPQ